MRSTCTTRLGHAELCPREVMPTAIAVGKVTNEFAGQAGCRQESRGLTHYPAWPKPHKTHKIGKLRANPRLVGRGK